MAAEEESRRVEGAMWPGVKGGCCSRSQRRHHNLRVLLKEDVLAARTNP